MYSNIDNTGLKNYSCQRHKVYKVFLSLCEPKA